MLEILRDQNVGQGLSGFSFKKELFETSQMCPHTQHRYKGKQRAYLVLPGTDKTSVPISQSAHY